MDYLRLALVTVNALAFLVLGVLSVRRRRRETITTIRRLWAVVALGCGAVIVGSLQRFALQAVTVGWLPDSIRETVTGEVQLIQSLVVLTLIAVAFFTVTRLSDAMVASDRMTESLLHRVRHVDLDRLHLTAREREVLTLIGEGTTTDADLAAGLHISKSTVQSHIKHLLRKTGLNRRTDLVAVAVLVEWAKERSNG